MNSTDKATAVGQLIAIVFVFLLAIGVSHLLGNDNNGTDNCPQGATPVVAEQRGC